MSESTLCRSLVVTSDYNNLFQAMLNCKGNGVGWKPHVQGFVKNGCTNCYQLSKQLTSGTYRSGPYKYFTIYEPKKRHIVAMYMKDRVVHRCFSDNYFYELITKSFIYDNFACQRGKGTLKARNRFKYQLQKHFRKYGMNGYMLKLDIHNFFGSIPHHKLMEMLEPRVDEFAYNFIYQMISIYETGKDENGMPVGIFLGSIITQLLGIAMLDRLDHIIKENLKIEHYVRYNDDMILISKDKEKLVDALNTIIEYLEKIGLSLNLNKSRIYRIDERIEFLRFNYRLTNTGKVIITVPKYRLKYKKRKLRNMVIACRDGKIRKDTIDEHVESYLEYISYGNNYKIKQRLKQYYLNLWEE